MPIDTIHIGRDISRTSIASHFHLPAYFDFFKNPFGLSPQKVYQHAVPHVLRYGAVEALHGLGDALLVGRNNVAEVFGVHARRERS